MMLLELAFTTIDKAGRVVIPAAIRAKAGLKPGTELEVTFDQVAIRLERKAPGPKLVRVGNRLRARSATASVCEKRNSQALTSNQLAIPPA